MLSLRLEIIINSAMKKANELKHEFITLEGLLLAMLSDEQVKEVIEKCGGIVDDIRGELEKFLKDEDQFAVLSDEEIIELNKEHFVDEELRKLAKQGGILYRPDLSVAIQRVIQRAALHVQSSGKDDIKGINLLVAIFGETKSFPVYVLQKNGIDRLHVLEVISHDLDKPLTQDDEDELDSKDSKRKKSALDKFTTNLNELAKNNQIDPLIGREIEVNRMIQILSRRRKNNPMLVGDAGVGKTAIAEGFARKIEEKRVPTELLGTTIYQLDLASMLAGAKYRGDFEARLKGVVKEIKKLNDQSRPCILFVDELHTLMGAGATGSGSLDASNLLKPALASGKLRVIGSTTFDEFRKFIEKDPAFGRRFQKIDVDEPSKEETIKIVKGLKDRFESHHQVKYSDKVIKMAVDLSVKHLTDRMLPDKAIDVIDEVGAYVKLNRSIGKNARKVGPKDIEEVISMMAKIPRQTVNAKEEKKLENLKTNLKYLIFGQDHAVDKVCDTILLSRSGLMTGQRPMANFLFAGPTGVGKTELAKQLSNNLGIEFIRFDMSEYMEKHSVAKLIGAPPGYVGFDQGGMLTDIVKKNPHAVLLLDEIEKAHPDIFNVLLQVMDSGRLTDAHGKSTDFTNTILIMTTNAGAQEMDTGQIGLMNVGSVENTSKRDKVIKNFFTPEFRNRLDEIIFFNKLPNEAILNVVDKFLVELEQILLTKKVEMDVDADARQWLADTGFDPKMGARPIQRIIDEQIKKRLSNEILFGELKKGGIVHISFKKSQLNFKFNQK